MALGTRAACTALAALLAGAACPASAQDGSVSREVVQPLPPEGSEELSVALRQLGKNPRDIDALVTAGRSALKLGDVDAAAGFYARAAAIAPDNGDVLAGRAAVLLRKENPFDALRLFEAAEKGGAARAEMAGDRGLAYDLVGDNARAQAEYWRAINAKENAEIRRRLAMSLAISGDQYGSEAVLLQLLQRQDLAAYRIRAFALAALGKTEDAVTIAEAVMPARLSSRMAPYLRYMPKLTRAQQAAAANLGNFPKAEQIGKDDPRVAQFASEQPQRLAARAPDARLVPGGEPMGQRGSGGSGRSKDPVAAKPKPDKPKPAKAPPAPPVVRRVSLPSPGAQPILLISLPPVPVPVRLAVAAVPPPVQPAPEPEPAPEPIGIADAFADFAVASPDQVRRAAGAVDIAALEPPREVREEKPAPPPPPKHPSRIWVQVATGRDVAALAFDWRRMTRKADALLAKRDAFTANWGQTNRLVFGPFDSDKAAQDMVGKLKAAGIDSFQFTSAEGERLKPL